MEILRKFYRPIILFFFIIGIQIYSIGKTNLFAFSDESIANTLHTSSAYPSNGEGDAPVYPEEEIKSRLRNMDLCVPVQYNDVVEGYLKGYLMLYRDKTERILGRTGMYNQYFERALRNADLPIDLQYVTILESALNPKAVSPSAAGGLWQFIPSTAVMYGLAINEFVDERSDPVKSSEIAAKYLAKLYDIFHDWQLALAAYNAGPNKITIAMKQARSNNFSTIKKYLSKETQNYISAFVAAAYVVQNYNSHGLNPKLPELDLLLTQSIRIKEPISFSQISQVTGVPTDLVSTLNPSYSQNYIPYNQAGNWLVIPSRVSKKMLQYLESPSSFDLSDARVIVSSDEDRNTVNYIKTTYTVEEGDNIDKLAKLFNCNAHHI
ncbi:MAG: transglycosylase SLT domain-containing protein, partial [Saprospiraceae bacterium]|nr:transglycosylase SLT domain-containing protein [Saprospiraceae bacterium]